MNEVVVTGMNSQYKAMSQQKNSINISNVISADQVSRFPDSNIGDALKRIPGISVQYDQGEARFGHVRGTSPDLSSVTIDGTRVPSAEAEMRSVQLDLIPADMIPVSYTHLYHRTSIHLLPVHCGTRRIQPHPAHQFFLPR